MVVAQWVSGRSRRALVWGFGAGGLERLRLLTDKNIWRKRYSGAEAVKPLRSKPFVSVGQKTGLTCGLLRTMFRSHGTDVLNLRLGNFRVVVLQKGSTICFVAPPQELSDSLGTRLAISC